MHTPGLLHIVMHLSRHVLLTSVARRTVSVRSPMRMPLRPAHAMSVTLGSWYTTKPYLHKQERGHKVSS